MPKKQDPPSGRTNSPKFRAGRTKIVDKETKMKQMVELRSRGVSYDRISSEIGINVRTVRKWWREYLLSIGVEIDLEVKERIAQLNRVVEKVLVGFHANTNDVYQVLAAMDRADRYNGVYAAVHQNNQKVKPTQPLLEVIIRNVDIEYPPDDYGDITTLPVEE